MTIDIMALRVVRRERYSSETRCMVVEQWQPLTTQFLLKLIAVCMQDNIIISVILVMNTAGS